MALKFSMNISTFFQDIELPLRFEKAKDFGFEAIEIQNPYELKPDGLRNLLKKNNLMCDLVNICEGYGFASDPFYQHKFFESLQTLNSYHFAVNFKKVHVLSGERNQAISEDDQLQMFISALQSLVSNDYLQDMNVIGLIEPICSKVNGNYFLNDFEKAIAIIKKIGNDHIKLLLDIFHLHNITGNVMRYLEVYYPYAGHIQISQDPERREPFCPGGNIDYTYVFDFLRQKKHSDYIGLEYTPSDSTAISFEWMKPYTA